MNNLYPNHLDNSRCDFVGATNCKKSNKFGDMEAGRSNDDVAARLDLLRRAHKIKSQAEFARRIDASPTKLNNYFRGLSRPELTTGIAIADHFQITLDWLYLGQWQGLPAAVHDHLREVERQSTQTG